MGYYMQPVQVKGVEFAYDAEKQKATLTTKLGKWEFIKGALIEFKGLDGYTLLIDEVYPNGIRVIESDSSAVAFHTWKELLEQGSIYRDAMCVTGWMKITK